MPLTISEPDTGAIGNAVGSGGGDGAVRLHPAASTHSSTSRRSRLDRMAIRDALLAEFDHEMATTRRLLDRIPDAQLAWKPHEKSMSLAGIGTHLGNIPNWGTMILDRPSYDLDDSPPNLAERHSRAEILAAFDEAAKQTRARMDRSDAEYEAHWVLKRGGQEVFSMPRATAFRTFVLYHTVHHRGQLSVYLRLNNVPVPAVYGPTADEG
jgi:uncharacterized damage-inducible protein DinB